MVRLVVAIGLPLVIGLIGSLITTPAIPIWYAGLEKPAFNPPNWLFGPVWTLLYVLMGVALYLAWSQAQPKRKKDALLWFGLQLALNLLWSVVFFGLQLPWLGVAVIALLFVAIIMTARAFWPISRPASYLLLPYAAWVAFATVLNASIALLNN